MCSGTSQILRSRAELDSALEALKKGKLKIGLVPTMGALHEGHISLIQVAKQHADVVICTIFVNPTQFSDSKDLEKYPRTEEKDLKLLNQIGCDFVFLPDLKTIYTQDHVAAKIVYNGLDQVMEGAFRPGHFDGVVEVVHRLFTLTDPYIACFGEKDFQQLAVINELVLQHEMGIEIIPCPILREKNGLAMSSRNERLSPQQRADAAVLCDTLTEMKGMTELMNPDELAQWGRDKINSQELCVLEYLEVCDSKSLRPVYRWKEADEVQAFVAARFGEIRLIDNMQLKP